MPTIRGNTGTKFYHAGNTVFNNLIELAPDIADSKADGYDGAMPSEIELSVRRDLDGYIVPSIRNDLPAAPNNLTEVKGPAGRSDHLLCLFCCRYIARSEFQCPVRSRCSCHIIIIHSVNDDQTGDGTVAYRAFHVLQLETNKRILKFLPEVLLFQVRVLLKSSSAHHLLSEMSLSVFEPLVTDVSLVAVERFSPDDCVLVNDCIARDDRILLSISCRVGSDRLLFPKCLGYTSIDSSSSSSSSSTPSSSSSSSPAVAAVRFCHCCERGNSV